MEYTPGGTDAKETEFTGLFQEYHAGQAEGRTGCAIKESVNAAAKGRRQDNPYEENQEDILFVGQGMSAITVIKLDKPSLAPGAMKGTGSIPSMIYNTKDWAINRPKIIRRNVLFMDIPLNGQE